MQKGEIPITYVIAIILGIVVLTLLGYLFFSEGGKFSGVVLEQTCKGKLQAYCSEWSKCSYDQSCEPNGQGFYDPKNNEDCKSIKEKLSDNKDDVTDACKKTLGKT